MKSYLSKEFSQFFIELSQNNTKLWFDENRKKYELYVKKPFENLVEKVIHNVQSIDDTIQINYNQAIFRINKDVRFSKDKLPYKTFKSALIAPFGTKKKEYPGIYFEIDAHNITIYAGIYMLDANLLYKIREDIVDYWDDFKSIILNEVFIKTFGSVKGVQLKRAPKDFKESVAEIPYLLNKNFYVMKSYPLADLKNEDLAMFVTNHYAIAKPFNDFFIRPIIS